MKNLLIAMALMFNLSSAQAAAPQAIFEYGNSSMLGGSFEQIQIRSDGVIQALVTEGFGADRRVKFEGAIARLDARNLQNVMNRLATVLPGLSVRRPTAEEQRNVDDCISENVINYSVLGAQFPQGRLKVRENYGCLMLGLDTRSAAGARAERALAPVIALVDKAVRDAAGVLNRR